MIDEGDEVVVLSISELAMLDSLGECVELVASLKREDVETKTVEVASVLESSETPEDFEGDDVAEGEDVTE